MLESEATRDVDERTEKSDVEKLQSVNDLPKTIGPDAPEEMNFSDLSLKEIPVRIEGEAYILREANGDAAARYRNAMLERTQLGKDGSPVGVRGMADVEPFLVSLCLFKDGKSVDVRTVRSWPAPVVKALFNKAQLISDLGEKAEDSVETLKKKLKEAEEDQRKREEEEKNFESSTGIGFELPMT